MIQFIDHFMTKIPLISILCILLTFNACTNETPLSQSPIKIALMTAFPGYTPAFIAKEKNLFTQYGATVELKGCFDQPTASRLYEDGKTEGLFVPFSDAIVLTSKGIATTVVYITDYSETADLIISRPELSHLSELRGKTIAFEGFNTFSHLFIAILLERAGIREGEFKAVNLESPRVLAALKSGQVDAGHIYEPDSSQALAEGFKVLAAAGDIPSIITDVLIFRTNIVKSRTQEIQSIVQALVAARELIETDSTEAFTIMGTAAATSAEAMAASFKKLHALDLTENIAAFKPNGTLFTTGQRIISFYEQRGQLQQRPSLSAIINDQFVTAAQRTQP